MTAVSKRGICMHTLPFGRRPEAGSETAGVKIKRQPIPAVFFICGIVGSGHISCSSRLTVFAISASPGA